MEVNKDKNWYERNCHEFGYWKKNTFDPVCSLVFNQNRNLYLIKFSF